MSELYAVSCPHCGASGQLSDPTLKGTAIYCPACSKAFVIPAATNTATALPIAPPVAAVAAPLPGAVPVATPVTQPIATPLAAPVAVPIAQAVIPGALPVATAIPVASVATPLPATPMSQPTVVDPASLDFPNVAAFQTDALTPTAASAKPTARRPGKPQSAQMGLLKVALLSILSAVSLFGIVVLSQKTPKKRLPPVLSEVTKKPKKSSRRKTTSVAPKVASVAPGTTPEEMSESEEIKPAEPELALAATTTKPAAPKMEKPAAPPPATPQPTAPAQTVENIPADVKDELDDAEEKKDSPRLIKLLAHPHAGVRLRVVQRLDYLDPNPDLAAALLPRLEDSNVEVRQRAIGPFTKHGASLPELIPALGKVLRQDRDSVARAYAANALGELARTSPERAAAVAGPLLEALDKGPAEDLSTVISEVGSLGDPGKPALPLLVSLMQDINFGESAATALAQLGLFEPLEPILAKQDGSTNGRKAAIAAGLEKRKPLTKEAFAILKRLTEDADKSVQARALNALSLAEPKLPEAIPLFEAGLASTNEDVRNAATKGMGLYASSDPERNMRALLAQMIKSEDEVWSFSKIAAAMVSNKVEGFEALVNILANPESTPEIRTAAGQVLAMSRHNDWYDTKHIDKIKKLFDDSEQSLTIRTGCAIALLSMKEADPRLGVTVLQVLTDPSIDLQVRAAAVYQVPKEQPGFLPALIAAATQCEAPVPEGVSLFESKKQVDFYTNLLGAMERFKADEDQQQLMPHIVPAIRHQSMYVKISALSASQRLNKPSPEIIDAIRETLRANSHKDNSQYVREAAFEAIGKLHRAAASALPDLRAALKSEDRDVRSSAVDALEEFGPEAVEAIPDLITALLGDEKQSASYVADTLAAIAPQNEMVLAAIIQSLDRPNLQEDGAKALQDMGPAAANAVPALRKLLASDMSQLRTEVLKALGKIGAAAKPAIPDIVTQLADRDKDVRSAAATALGDLQQHAAEAVPDLAKLLGDPVEDVQFSAVYSLQRIGPAAKTAVPELEKYLAATTSNQMKKFAKDALEKLQADPGDADPVLFDRLLDDAKWEALSGNQVAQLELSVPELAKLLRNQSSAVRERAMILLNGLRYRHAGRKVLEKLLNGSEVRDQALAASLLRELPTSGGSPELAQALLPWIENKETSSYAAHVLTEIGAAANPVIVTVLTNEKLPPEIRQNVVYSLLSPSAFNVAQLLPDLQPALKSENPDQRRAVALSILRLDPRNAEALPIVLECLTNTDKDIQTYAREALRQSAESEVDVQAAIPELVAILAKPPEDLASDSSDDSFRARLDASAILLLTGVRQEDVPALQDSLAKLAAPKDRNGQPIEKLNYFGSMKVKMCASLAIQALGTVGAPATAALPEIRQLLTQGHGVNDDEYAARYAQGILRIGEPAIEMVIELAKQADANRQGRQLAIQVLGQVGDGDQRTTAILTELLKDPDVDVRLTTAMVLAEHAATFEAAIPVLCEGLRIQAEGDENGNRQSQIVSRFLNFKSQAQSAVPSLLELVKEDKQPAELRGNAARAMLQIAPDSPEVRAAYLNCLKTASESVMGGLIPSTQELPATVVAEIVGELTKIVEDAAHPRRAIAVAMLAQFEDQAAAAIPALRSLITTDKGPAGISATIAVARIDPTAKDLVPRVVELLLADPHRRSAAAEALRCQGPNAATELPSIIKFYQTEGYFDYHVFRIIGSMGPESKPGLPVLFEEALKRERFNYTAFEALKNLGPHAAELWPQLLAQLQDHDDLPGVALALAAIGGEPARDAVTLLQKRLSDEKRRLAAIRYLAEFKALAAPAVPELITFATGTDVELRLEAIRALGQIGPEAKAAAETLAALLADPDPAIAGYAASSLAGLRAEALPVLPQIIAALEKPRRCTQTNLLYWLQVTAPPVKDAIPTITKLRATTDLRLRHQCRLVLEKLESPAAAKAP